MLLTATMLAVLMPMPMAQATGAKTVHITFVNYLDGRTLFVSTPAGTTPIGAFGYGGKLTVSISVPADGSISVIWKAGHLEGFFTLTSDSADYLRIDLKRGGVVGPYAVDAP